MASRLRENQRQALKEAFIRCEANGKKAVMWEVAQAAAERLAQTFGQAQLRPGLHALDAGRAQRLLS